MKRFFKEIQKYADYILFSAKAQLRAEVKNAYLDWLWWVLEPLGFMLIYVFIFSGIFGSSIEYFPIFVFIGNTIWTFFSRCISASVQMIRSNRVTISKVYVPKYIFCIETMLVSFYKMWISFFLILAMMLAYGVPFSWRIILILPAFFVMFVFTFGLGCLCAHIGVFVADMSYIVSIGLNMLMFVSGIFYSMESVPFGRVMERVNPVAFLISFARSVILYNARPDYIMLFVWLLAAMMIAVAGVGIIYKNENNYLKVV